MQKIISLICICILTTSTFAQTQKGTDLDGEASEDFSGSSGSMPDINTIAIGAPWNDESGDKAGHVRIFEWNGSVWIQKGIDIDGESAGDWSGKSVSMPDVNTVAIGAEGNDENGGDAGHVRIYEWDGSTWIQKGLDIDGEVAGDKSGRSVSMPNANTVAIGAPLNDENGNNAGQVRINEWNGSAWIQKGIDINGEAPDDWSGGSVSMPDANTVAIGAERNDGNGSNAGHVRIFEWNGSAWIQKGLDIDGEATGDQSGYSVFMSDNNTIAIGAWLNSGQTGHVRIYAWDGSAWLQKGMDIDGISNFDFFGLSVSMPDANTVAIGAHQDGYGNDAGYVRIYAWNSSEWVPQGNVIHGEAANDRSGRFVCMPDANTVAIGAIHNDGNGANAGHVRVYTFEPSAIIENGFGEGLIFYPNPTDGNLRIDLADNYNNVHVIVRNTLGQEVINKSYNSTNHIDMLVEGESGVYIIEINSENKTAIFRIVKD